MLISSFFNRILIEKFLEDTFLTTPPFFHSFVVLLRSGSQSRNEKFQTALLDPHGLIGSSSYLTFKEGTLFLSSK